MKSTLLRWIAGVFVLILLGIGREFVQRGSEGAGGGARGGGVRAYPVETAAVRVGVIEDRRTFSGTLEPWAATAVAARVEGRVARVLADLGDEVEKDGVVAELEDAEYRQGVAGAEAALAVARARLREATNRLLIADRELARARELAEQGIRTASDLDAAEGEHLVRMSALEVAKAEVEAGEAALATAEIRLADTRVRAVWSEGDGTRRVSARLAEEGDTVSENEVLMHVVEIDRLRAVFFVPERDYARLEKGQAVGLAADAWPGEVFPAVIERIAPVFQEESRQARVEILAENAGHRLKPGMFVRATVTLERREGARVVPANALTRRGGETGIFLVDGETETAVWRVVETGIRDGDAVEVRGEGIAGRVVVLGQQLLEDGVPVLRRDGDGAEAGAGDA